MKAIEFDQHVRNANCLLKIVVRNSASIYTVHLLIVHSQYKTCQMGITTSS